MTLSHPEAEESTIGAILLEPGRLALLRPILPDPSAFANPEYATIYRTICKLHDNGSPIDHVTLGSSLPPEVASHLPELLEAGYEGNHEAHARMVGDAFQRRRTLALAERLAARCKDGELPLTQTLAGMVGEISKLAGDGITKKPPTLTQSLMNVVEGIGKPPAHGTTRGAPTGLRGWDALMDGFVPGLNIIAGRPSAGKTAVALRSARRIAEYGPVWIGSLETTHEKIAARLFQSEVGKSTKWLGECDARVAEWMERIMEASGRLASLPITIAEGTDSPGSIRLAWQAECAQGRKPTAVIIDYLQLMHGDSGRYERRELEIGSITRTLKMWGLKERLPVILLCQLNRDNVKENRKPRLTDLRESGNIEQDADTVTLIHWPNGNTEAGEQAVDLIVAKNKDGETGTCHTLFEPWTFRFRDSPS